VDVRRAGILPGAPKRVGPAAALVVREFRGRHRCLILEREIADALGKLATGELPEDGSQAGHRGAGSGSLAVQPPESGPPDAVACRVKTSFLRL